MIQASAAGRMELLRMCLGNPAFARRRGVDVLANVIAVFPSTDSAGWIVARLSYRFFWAHWQFGRGLLSRQPTVWTLRRLLRRAR